ncbi:MAG: hypothetical protein KAH54_08510 [Candidatus Sabulitectum sp.]|nr:hypothetical protein [Candidatus Sabulitectum sp.]
MEEFIARLLDLQDCDRGIDRLRADLESIPRELKIHRMDTQGHEAKFSLFRDNLDGIRKKQQKLTTDRSDNVTRIADYKSKLISLKSNSEYTTMLKQIANTEKMIDQIDNMIIETMYEEDEASRALEKALKERDRAVKRSSLREESLKEKLSELEKGLESMKADRSEIASRVDQRQLKMYEKSRSSGHREVVTGVMNGSCGGCLTKIPSQSAGEIKGGKTYVCPLCGSYVVWTSDSSF